MSDAKYKNLLDYLSEKDKIPVADLPKGLGDVALLSGAWLNGLVEFGRRSPIATGVPDHLSKAIGKKLIFDDDMKPTSWSWTGPKRNADRHKQLKDILAEDEAVTLIDHETLPKTLPDPRLRLHVRLTDKGLATLAA